MKKLLSLLLMFSLLLSLAACGTKETDTNSKTRTVTDALGREVQVPETVERIVPLGNTPRMITYLGLADKVVGIGSMAWEDVTPLTAYAYAMKELWKELPIVGTDSMGNTDYYPEQIIAADPDVILCTYTEDIVNDIESKTGIPVIAVGMGTLFAEDYNESLRILADVCGVSERAEKVIAFINACLSDLDTRTADIPEAEKPSVLSAAATYKGVHGIEGVRLRDPVLDVLHVNNVAAQDNGPDAATVDREQILTWNPDYIFCDFGGVGLVKTDEAADPNFYAQLNAYNEGRIYQHPSTTSYFSNVEIPLLNGYYIGSVLYPERFADVDIAAKAEEIFSFLLGYENFMGELEAYGAYYGAIDFDN